MKIINLTIWLLILSKQLAIRPGVVTQIHLATLNKFIVELLPAINSHLKDITLDQEINMDDITVKKSLVHVQPFQSNDIYIDQAETDHFHLVCKDIKFDILNEVETHWWHFKSSGRVKTRGHINQTISKITFKGFNPDDPRPYVDLQVEDMTITPKDWDINVDISNIPNFAVNLIIKMFKTKILKEMISKIINAVNEKAKTIVNEKLQAQYPFHVDSKFNVSLETALTDGPQIERNNMLVEVDGTFFDTTNGYRRINEPEPINLQRDDKSLVDVFVSEFTVNSIFAALYNKDLEVNFGPLILSLKVKENKQFITFVKGKILLNDFQFSGRVQLGSYYSNLDASVDGKFGIKGFDPITKKIGFDIIDLDFRSFSIDSNWHQINEYSKIIGLALQIAIKQKEVFWIKVPEFELPLDINILNLDFKVYENNLKVGLDFDVKDIVKKLFFN